MKYYSLNNILKKNATYNIIIGQRSNGKSYSVLKYALEDYVKNKNQLAIIRRWREDIIGKRATEIFSAINNDNLVKKYTKNKFSEIYYYSGKFYLANRDENGKVIYNDNDIIAYIFALSDNEHNKSISYPSINNVLFDEFIAKSLYLNDEFVLFMNTLSSIIRNRENVKIFMLGNTVNKFCPYFQEMGLTNILKMKQGSIDLYKYSNSKLTVAVEYCENMKNSKDNNNYYFAFNNPKLEMITSGIWELDLFPHLNIKYDKKDILFIYFIQFDDNIYQCEIVLKDNNCFTYIHEKTTPIKNINNDLIFSDKISEKNNIKNGLKITDNFSKKILKFFQENKVFYQNNDVGNAIQNFIKNY